MRPLILRTGKIIAMLCAILTICVLCLSPLMAQTETAPFFARGGGGQGGVTPPNAGTGTTANTGNYLYNIMINTAGILKKVDDLPIMLKNLTTMALSWTLPDKTDSTANLQQEFASFANVFLTENAQQLSLQPRLLADLFNHATPQTMPYANDLTFTTLLGQPYFSKDPRNQAGRPPTVDPAFNYIKNASGLGIQHTLPGEGGFSGFPYDQARYLYFFSTTEAVESFNAYILSNLYAESKNPGAGFTPVQQSLLQQSSSSDWFSQVSSANLGVVLRQLLMYQSQIFALMSQLIKIEKQQLEAQVLTNSIIMAGNISTEATLLNRARSKQPS